MIKQKYISIIAWAGMILAVATLLCCVLFYDHLTAAASSSTVSVAYESELFDKTSLIQVNIIMDADQWQDLLDNAINEEYYACDVEINGTVYKNVGIRAKGNTSLTQVANDDTTNRYSFKLEFDHYVTNQTCFGLDKLVLNNNISDATQMKEYLCYDMFAFLDVPSSLYSYAKIQVNGSDWGVYLALEGVDESFAARNYGLDYGELYKPEGLGVGGAGKMGELNAEDRDGNMGGGMMSSGSSGGADLAYTDDVLDSYSTIWDGSVFDTSGDDHQRVVTALKNLCESTNLDTYVDIENVLKYWAVQTFVVNLDSLSGNMAHNYYLYESNGQISMVPWDYNLAFGGFQSGDASSAVNFPIDTPFSGVSIEDRPIFQKLMEVDEYNELYHSYLDTLVNEYVLDGQFEAIYTRIKNLISEEVSNDPTSFYTYEEFEQGASALKNFIYLRAASIQGQLNGAIPATIDGQSADSSALIDATGINLSDMGSQGGGMGEGIGGGNGDRGVIDENGGMNGMRGGMNGENNKPNMMENNGGNPFGNTSPGMTQDQEAPSSSMIPAMTILGALLAVILLAMMILRIYKHRKI